VDLQPAQTYSAPAAPSVDRSRPAEEQSVMAAANFRYELRSLATRRRNFSEPGDCHAQRGADAVAACGDQVNFSLDGSQVSNEDSPTSASVVFPDRGAHTATVRITDRYGKVVCDTNTTFHVLRTNLNSPSRPVNPASAAAESAASHAALITSRRSPCLAGGPHGG
jgi:hypothetical protein